ncbi:hypothetical protein LVJ77_08700 [Conchiformibius kuhniae]|uniref:Uncharacterized protein n=1 Tax=Conchiformibius kuhniae TaxID=211502 RepID=A0A8T9MTH3_9NEIS|nr:hypothetical protein LVJ77_08700 [Conchiformibius kuhniae]
MLLHPASEVANYTRFGRLCQGFRVKNGKIGYNKRSKFCQVRQIVIDVAAFVVKMPFRFETLPFAAVK